MNKTLGILAILIWVISTVVLVGCSEENRVVNTTPEKQLNPNLHRLLYWGEIDALNWGPNVGRPVADLLYPIWTSADRICLFTRTVTDGSTLRGIFEIEFDPQSYEFTRYEAFEFDYCMVLLAYAADRDQFIIGFGDESDQLVAKYATLEEGVVVLHDDVVPAGWDPFGVYVADRTHETYFYGRNPSTNVAGFYRRQGSAAILIREVDLEPTQARAASVSSNGETLFFGMTIGPRYDATTQLCALSTRNGNVELILERRGVFVDVEANPVDSSVLLLGYFDWTDHLNHVELIDLGINHEGVELDVNTRPNGGMFVTSDWLKWSPDGRSFTFCAGEFSGEGGRPPLEVWAYSLE